MKRHLNWKNIGFVTSVLVGIIAFCYIILKDINTLFFHYHPSTEDGYTIIIASIILIWSVYRNRNYTINEYINKWRNHK